MLLIKLKPLALFTHTWLWQTYIYIYIYIYSLVFLQYRYQNMWYIFRQYLFYTIENKTRKQYWHLSNFWLQSGEGNISWAYSHSQILNENYFFQPDYTDALIHSSSLFVRNSKGRTNSKWKKPQRFDWKLNFNGFW